MRTVQFATIAAALIAAVPAGAATIAFSGTFTNTNPPASPTGRCAPAASTVSIAPGLGTNAGTSNFGSFTATNSHCIVLPLPAPYTNGLFSFAFDAGDLLNGTYSGALSATATPGTFANLQSFVVTGGTGRFAGASGSFTGNGTVVFGAGPPSAFVTLSGLVNAPAVPEPASWALLLTGFGIVGAALRSRRAGGYVVQ